MAEKRTMKTPKPGQLAIIYFVLAFILLATSILTWSNTLGNGNAEKDARKFEKVLHKKERFLREEFRQLEILFTNHHTTQSCNDWV